MLHVLLPVHNRAVVTRNIVACLKAQADIDFHLLLLDDGSTDNTAMMVTDELVKVTVIRGGGNWWWGGALHQGYLWLIMHRVPASDVVVILNDDTEFDDHFLVKGVEFLKNNPRTLLLATCYDKNNGRLLDRGTHVDWGKFTFEQAGSPSEINCVATRGLFFRVEVFLETGGFYPRLIPHYLSDYEFTIRAHRKGMRLCTTPEVSLRLNSSMTGLQVVDSATFKEAARTLFSLKSANNLKSWTFFVLLACPAIYVPLNLARVYLHAIKVLLGLLRSAASTHKTTE